MTWAIHVINYLDIDDVEKATEILNRSYSVYQRKPFYVWTEVTEQYEGAGNFITGAGGFLQAIINGYGGIRLRDDQLIVTRSRLPPETTQLSFNGITYLGSVFHFEVNTDDTSIIQFTSFNDAIPLDIKKNGEAVCATGNACKIELVHDDEVVLQAKISPFGDQCSIGDGIIKLVDINSGMMLQMSIILILLCGILHYLF